MPTIGSIAGKLTAKKRNKLPSSTFGLPGERKYPMPDRSHAANAKARATQQVAKGNLSPSQKSAIDAKANRILGKTGKSKPKRETYASVKRAMAKRPK
jgi:hypothetical protein